MKRRGVAGFVPIALERYVELHLKSNQSVKRSDLIERLGYALDAYRRGERCQCGQPIWVVGSAEAGLACFTCITGEASPSKDYELAEAAEKPDPAQVERLRGAR